MSVKKKLPKSKRGGAKQGKVGTAAKSKKFKPVKKRTKQNVVAKRAPEAVESEEESDHGEDMLGMVEAEDIEFLKNVINERSYTLFNKVRYSGTQNKSKKRKHDDTADDETLENNYEVDSKETRKVKHLLPIKTKDGVMRRVVEQEDEDNAEDEGDVEEEVEDASEEEEETEEGDYTLMETDLDLSQPVTPAQLMKARNETLHRNKVYIGSLSSGLLENPEEKITNFRLLLKVLDDKTPEAYVTIRKLAMVSLLEVFKDVLPTYQIKLQDISNVKVKKDTLKLHKFEESLLQYYKKYLQKLEKLAGVLYKKKGDTRVRSQGDITLGEVAVHAMCDLLVAHPYFNYSQNLAQAVVPFLNNKNRNVREIVASAVKTVFKEDKKEEITLKLMRIINQYLKNRAHNVNPDMLEVLLHLKIKDVNLDQEKEHDLKQKKLMAHKQNVLTLSKKERKRKKRLQELENELLETKAEENRQSKRQNLTEITKVLFGIYFRILKSSTNPKVLGVCLEGLAKFAHCINLEYYMDIVNVLDKLLKEKWTGYREKLHCVQTVFAILGGQGEIINIDPSRFYTYLYADMFATHAARTHVNFSILLHTITSAIIKRRKKITSKRLVGFVKRLTTLSLQLLHNSALSCLAVVKTVLQLNKAADILLDLDNSIGDGKFDPELDDPEYCCAASTALYEVVLLSRHYHPVVSKYAKHIASGVPASGDGSLPPQYGKCTPEQLYTDFDMSEMVFSPAVPVPKKAQPKARPSRHSFADAGFGVSLEHNLKVYSKKRTPFYMEC